MERVATIATTLEAEQASGNSNKTQLKTTFNGSNSQGTYLGEGIPRSQDTKGPLMLKLDLRLSLTYPMMHHSGEVTHSKVLRVVLN